MRSPLALLRRRSLRLRVTIAFVATAAVLALALSLVTLLTVRSFMESQRIRSSNRQTVFALLFAREFVRTDPNAADLVTRLQIRQSFDAMVTDGSEWFATSLSLTPDIVPAGLRAIVTKERLGYQIAKPRGEDRLLIFGSPLPPPGMDLYLFFPLEDVDRTLSLLGRVMAVAGVLIVVVVALIARRVTSGIMHPLAAVSDATRRMAEGLLETRVTPTSQDEVGQLATSFNQMAEALRGMIERERYFVAAASHELRTPLAALKASGDVLAAHREQLPDEGREALDLIREDIAALNQLVQELLEISELDAGRAPVRVEPIRLRTFSEALLRRRRYDAALTGEDLVAHTDKARLERVLGNLIDNAFTHGGGTDVRVAIGTDDGAVTVTVSDAGPGIPAADREKLFTRFYRSDRSRSRDRGGVGLGLAIAQENSRLLGGSIALSDDGGSRTVFTLRLPAQAPEPTQEIG